MLGTLLLWGTTTTTATSSPEDDIPTNGLIAWYKLEETSGQTMNDSSPVGTNSGTLGSTTGEDTNDPAWVTPTGGGLVFDGVDNYCLLPALLNPVGQDLTIFVAFRTNDTGANQQILSQQDGTGTGRALMALNSSERVFSAIGLGTGTSLTHTTILADESDHCATVSMNGNTLAIYIDGGSKQTATRTAEAATGAWVMGASKTFNQFYSRTIYYVLVYNRALSDAEVSTTYTAIKGVLAGRGITLP